MSKQIINPDTTENFMEVFSALDRDEKDRPRKTINNFLTILTTDRQIMGCVRFNELTNSAENTQTGVIWQESDDAILRCYIEKNYGLRQSECYMDAFLIVCRQNTYNPVRDILDNLKWDGTKRINQLLQKYLGCEDSPYTEEIARLLFAGGVARVYKPGCKFDYMAILRGKQGAGKSSFVRWLAMDDRFFREIATMEDQKGIEALAGCWIGEVSELLALTKMKDIEAVKSYITRQNDAYRKPYERRITDNPRRCILVGSTNRTEFLNDKSGARRFFPLETKVNGFDLFDREQECRSDIVQCWAEAKHYYDTGDYSLVPKREMMETILEKQAEAMQDDWRVGMIEKYLEHKQATCVKDLWDNALSLSEKECSKKDSSDIVEIMDNFEDWEKCSTIRFSEYGRQRGWRKISEMNEKFPGIGDKFVNQVPGEMPF